MPSKHLLIAVSVATVIIGGSTARAESAVDEAGALACFTDKWDEKEQEKGHKLVDYAARCVGIPDDSSLPKDAESCTGKYEYMPDGSWQGNGTCTRTFAPGDTITDAFAEGSHLKEYVYKVIGGTGKYKGASGGGTYTFDNINDTVGGGRFKGKVILP